MEKHEMKKWCSDHMHRYVLAHTKEGYCCDGIIEHIDDEIVCIAVPVGGGMEYDPRALTPVPFAGGPGAVPPYPGGPYPVPPYAVPPLYPYPYYPRRRFARQIFPLAALLGLALLPYY